MDLNATYRELMKLKDKAALAKMELLEFTNRVQQMELEYWRAENSYLRQLREKYEKKPAIKPKDSRTKEKPKESELENNPKGIEWD